MSKILAVADIHIHDYPNRNPENDYRLRQDRIVAQNIIEAGKKYGCDTIVFAGDIIEKSLIRSYIQAEVKDFLYTVMSNFKQGFIIWGNHDQENKSSDQNINDSVLGVILPPNLYYAHQKTLKIDNTLFGFSNWQPDFDLSWIPGKVDILFTHARICYSPAGATAGDIFSSQVLDESKFDLAICGDIHKPATLGKYVSIGIPQRCKMGDSDKCTGVVIDCVTKNWEHIDLNPHDNLMKFGYTSILTEEGWHDDINTWLIYRSSGTIDTGTSVSAPAWEEVENLVNNLIVSNNLQEVHGEVLKNIKDINAGEVDFNFTLISLHCKNWRSIDDVTMYFNDGDKILIKGANGSGKSSLLSALKYAFVDVKGSGYRSLDSFIQFGAKDCLTEVEFMYQGNKCKLTRGTKDWGLEINGKALKYNNKTAFEADIRYRFPFIEYMDLFFLDADHSQLIGGMSDERRNLIISKFLKLDKIDTLHDTATLLYEQFRKEDVVWQGKLREAKKILEVANGKLATITLPTISKKDLEDQRKQGLEIQRKNSEWTKYLTESAGLQATITNCDDKLKELNTELGSLRDQSVIVSEIESITKKISEGYEEISRLKNIETEYNSVNNEIERLRAEGNKVWSELQELEIGKVCSHCGQPIKTTKSLDAHKKTLQQKVEEIKSQISSLQESLGKLESDKTQAESRIIEISGGIKSLDDLKSERTLEFSKRSLLTREIESESKKLEDSKNKLSSLGVVEKAELPDDFMEIMESITNQINIWNDYEIKMGDIAAYQQEVTNNETEVNRLAGILSSLEAYINLTGPVGQIYFEIFTKLSGEFSDSLVNYTVSKFVKNNKDHLNLVSQYNNNGNLVDYIACSSGQKTVLDVHFMQKIISRIGLVVLDEFLKHLDPENHDLCLEMISGMNIGCTMISSHMESIAAFNNKSCKLSLNPSGLTKIDFE